MPQFRLARNGTPQELQEVPLQNWLEAAITAEQDDWFEGIGELDSIQKVETIQAVSRVVAPAGIAGYLNSLQDWSLCSMTGR
jgi:hypothetical protein